MAYRRFQERGMGRTPAEDAVCKASFAGGFFSPTCWSALVLSPVAPPPAPTGAALTTPPASGEEAQALVDSLVNQQLADQQALNAGNVQSSWWDSLTGNTYSAASSVASGATSMLPWVLGAIGLGIFAIVAIGSGSPRRYGR